MSKIYEVEGDILLSGAQAIAHGVAEGDHFDTSLALALRERWPALAKDFRHYCHLDHPEAGEAWAWGGVSADGKVVRIFNLLTQEPAEDAVGRPGRAKVEYVSRALRELARLVREEGIKSLALPRLSTGVGGLNWSEVKPLIEHHLSGLNIPVYVYAVYRKGVKAAEPA